MTFPALSKKDEYDELTVPAYLYKRLLNLLQEEWAKRRCSPACWSLGSTSLCDSENWRLAHWTLPVGNSSFTRKPATSINILQFLAQATPDDHVQPSQSQPFWESLRQVANRRSLNSFTSHVELSPTWPLGILLLRCCHVGWKTDWTAGIKWRVLSALGKQDCVVKAIHVIQTTELLLSYINFISPLFCLIHLNSIILLFPSFSHLVPSSWLRFCDR